jgi:CubicO group peptidase (beta-lactamase class C family)
MQLVEEGKLDLGAPVSRYLEGLPAAWGKVTIRQLLTHVSGIPDLWDKHTRMLAESEEALVSKLQSLPMEFPTGERVSYNQTNYYLLGKVITKLAGKPFTQFIADRQFQVVGMPHTGFGDGHDVVPHLAGSYCFCSQTDSQATTTNGLRSIVRDWPTYIWTAVALNTTAEDLAHWVIALQSGKLLKPASLVTLWTPGTLNDGSVGVLNPFMGGYAIGWPLVIRPQHRVVASTGGNRAALFLYPDDDLSIILLTNLIGSGPERFMDQIASIYLPDIRASGLGLPPAIQRLNTALRQEGFENALAVAQRLQEKDSALKLPEDELTTWAYQLLEEGEDQASIHVFKLTVSMYPKSANTYDSLAEAYETTGDKPRAIQNYARSLELDPKNTNAVEHLAKLRGTPGPAPVRY